MDPSTRNHRDAERSRRADRAAHDGRSRVVDLRRSTPAGGAKYEFGRFVLNPAEHLLLREGQPVGLTPKAFDLLVYLVERHGRLVEKHALLGALWPDAIVEEANLAYNISALRKVLDADDESGSMIQTVPTRGYRFVASVRVIVPTAASLDSHDAVDADGRRTHSMSSAHVVVVAILIVFACSGAGVFLWFWQGKNRVAAEPTLVRLTSNPAELSVTSAQISPDGRYLAFADPSGLQVRLIDNRETHHIPDTKGMNVIGWTPDSGGVIASQCDAQSCIGWTISLVGEERYRTGATWPVDAEVRVAPDGVQLLRLEFTGASSQLSVDPMNGASPVRLLTAQPIVSAHWSVDGARIVYVTTRPTIETVPAHGGRPQEVFRAPTNQIIYDAVELPGGDVVFAMLPPGAAPGASTEVELWKLQIDERGVVRAAARRLTSGAASPYILSASKSGDRVIFLSLSIQTDVYVADYNSRNGVTAMPRRLTLDERDDYAYSWTTDSTTLLINSTRNGTTDVYKQRVSSTVAEPFATGPRNQGYAFATNDGRWVLYLDGDFSGRSVMRAPLAGGAAQELVPSVGGQTRIQCAVHGRCVLLEEKGGAFVISSLDPVKGKGPQLASPPRSTFGFHISPDGDAFAYILPTDDGLRNRIRVISFTGKPTTDIVAQHASRLGSLEWLPNGAGFVTTGRFSPGGGNRLLMTVSPTGVSNVLWAPAALSVSGAVPSPDSKHIAIDVSSRQSNVWMMTGF